MGITSNAMLSRSGESRHPCFAPDFRGKAFSFCPFNIMLAAGFLYMAFIILRHALFAPTLLRVFIINGCCTLTSAFSESIDIIFAFCFHTVYVVYYMY